MEDKEMLIESNDERTNRKILFKVTCMRFRW